MFINNTFAPLLCQPLISAMTVLCVDVCT